MGIFFLYGLIIACSLGYLTAVRFVEMDNPGERVAVSVPLGFGIVSLVLFAAYQVPLPFVVWKAVSIIFFIFVVAKAWRARGCVMEWRRDKINLRDPGLKYWTIFCALFFVSLIFSIYFPTMTPDGFEFDYLGKVLASEKGMSSYYQEVSRFRTPLIPILHSYFYLFDFAYPKILYPLFYLSVILFTYFKLKERGVGNKYAVMSALVLACTPVFWWRSYLALNNLVAACYFFFAVVYWFESLDRRGEDMRRRYLLSGIFFGLAVWTRVDFLFHFIPALLILMWLARDDVEIKRNLYYFWTFPVLIAAGWALVVSLGGRDFFGVKFYFIVVVILLYCLTLFYSKEMARKAIIAASILSFAACFIILPEGVVALIFSQINKFISHFAFRFVCYFFKQGYWIFTVFLVLLVPFFWKRMERGEKVLTLFLAVFYLGVIVVMFGAGDIPRFYNWDMWPLIKYFVASPGVHINGSSQRIYLAFYPILVFLVGSFLFSRNYLDGVRLGIKKYSSGIFNLMILGNIVLLLIFFAAPRIKFIYNHPRLDFKNALISDHFDIYNVYKESNRFAYQIKEALPAGSVVFFPKDVVVGSFSVKNIIFPIRGVFFEGAGAIKSELFSREKTYLVSPDPIPLLKERKVLRTPFKEGFLQVYKLG